MSEGTFNSTSGAMGGFSWSTYDVTLEHAEFVGREVARLTELLELFHAALTSYDATQCWMPESCAEAIADGEEHGWCGGCLTRAALEAYDARLGES